VPCELPMVGMVAYARGAGVANGCQTGKDLEIDICPYTCLLN
jgi:hypothetical protein